MVRDELEGQGQMIWSLADHGKETGYFKLWREALVCFEQDSDMYVLHLRKIEGNGLQSSREISCHGISKKFLERGNTKLCWILLRGRVRWGPKKYPLDLAGWRPLRAWTRHSSWQSQDGKPIRVGRREKGALRRDWKGEALGLGMTSQLRMNVRQGGKMGSREALCIEQGDLQPHSLLQQRECGSLK